MRTVTEMERGRVDLRGWFISVLCWDGILPLFVLAVPHLAIWLRADRQTSELVAIVTPVVAFFVRLFVGIRRINANHGGPILHRVQCVVFFLAAVYLVCLDTTMLVVMEMNNGWALTNTADVLAWLVLWIPYFLAMLFALYPGRSRDQRQSEASEARSHNPFMDPHFPIQ